MTAAHFSESHGAMQALTAQVDLLCALVDRWRKALELIRDTGDAHAQAVASRALREEQ